MGLYDIALKLKHDQYWLSSKKHANDHPLIIDLINQLTSMRNAYLQPYVLMA